MRPIHRLSVPVLSLACIALFADGCANRGMQPPPPPTPVASVASCTVTRGECIQESPGLTAPQCDTFQTTPTLIGTACAADSTQAALDAACKAEFCTRPHANPTVAYDFQPCTATGALADPANLPYEGPGMSAFVLDNGVVYHTYSAYARGLDALWNMWQWLDRAPLGRNEGDFSWFRRRDTYGTAESLAR